MLSLEELKDTLRLIQNVGQRRYGHFDHDANCFTGPQSGSVKRAGVNTSKNKLKTKTGSKWGLHEKFEDPDTGEVLYRRVK